MWDSPPRASGARNSGSLHRFIHMRDMTHSYVWCDSFLCVTWLVHMCDVTRSFVWRDSFICVTWLIRMPSQVHAYVCDDWSYLWRDSFICVTWLIDTCHSHVWQGSRSFMGECKHSSTRRHRPLNLFISLKWPIYMCNVTRCICVAGLALICRRVFPWNDLFTRITWLVHMCDVTHSYVWRNSFIRVTWFIHMCDVSHSCVWHDSHTWLVHMCDRARAAMGWLRLVGFLKS